MRSLAASILGLVLVFTGHVAHAQAPAPPGRVMVGGVRVDPQRLSQLAQAKPGETAPPDARAAREVFGVQDFAYLNIGPCELMPRGAAEFLKVETGDCGTLQVLSGQADLFVGAEVHLPNGVLVDQITIFYRDTNFGANPSSGFWRTSTTGVPTSIQAVDPPGVFAGGDASFTVDLATPHTVDNTTNKYSYLVGLSRSPITTTEEVALYRARIRYRRQVSPAPVNARFQDVPTNHVFFQAVEALAASGITFGCNAAPPLYCPDDPLTRGQLAAFLARALGLHFPD